jgi:hypothetical protein
MNTSEEFFRERLYPLQDGILALVRRSGAPFYLTGGTALSRRWFAHGFSEDLGSAVADAQLKEGGLDPVLVHEILRSVPVQELSRVLWSSPVDVQRAKADLAAIADDILYGRGNSVFPGPC